MEFPVEPEFGLKSQILRVPLVRISRSDCNNKQSPNISDLTQEKFVVVFFVVVTSRSSVEGNGNPLQYSCLENPMDGGAW